jgi:hypothetical protein
VFDAAEESHEPLAGAATVGEGRGGGWGIKKLPPIADSISGESEAPRVYAINNRPSLASSFL